LKEAVSKISIKESPLNPSLNLKSFLITINEGKRNIDFSPLEVMLFFLLQLLFSNFFRKTLTAQAFFLPLGQRVSMYLKGKTVEEIIGQAIKKKLSGEDASPKVIAEDDLITAEEEQKLLALYVNLGFQIFTAFSEAFGLVYLRRESKKEKYTVKIKKEFFDSLLTKPEILILFLEPTYLPMVCPPNVWTPFQKGGYLFNLEDNNPLYKKIPLLKKSPFLEGNIGENSELYNVINNLQRIPFQIESQYIALLDKIDKLFPFSKVEEENQQVDDYLTLKFADTFVTERSIQIIEKDYKILLEEFVKVKDLSYKNHERISKKYDYIQFANKRKALIQRREVQLF
jgi:hypothetical protein